MKKTDILIIGGGPAGIVAALTAKQNYPSKEITLIRQEQKVVIPCGIPYIFHRLTSIDQNIIPDQPLIENKIDLVVQKVVAIKPEEKTVILENNEQFQYDKLILATGSSPRIIPIPGADKDGVIFIKKDYQYLKSIRQALLAAKNVVIIGGGFIGVEIAEELSGLEKVNISIVEMLDHCLMSNFDEEFAIAAEKKLEEKGVKIYTKSKVKSIGGQDKAEYVELENGEKIEADIVIVSAGAKANVDLAKNAGLKVEERGGIWVDEYLRTSQPDILAIGDCAQTKDFITGKNVPIMLASIATSEARIAANNLYQLQDLRENKGTCGAFATSVNGLTLAAAGLTESRAKKENIDYVVGQAQAVNRHPGSLPGAQPITAKLIFSKSSERLLLGGQIMGPECVGEMINIVAIAIQQKTSIFDLLNWQIATHPLLTAAPTTYPLIIAAQDAKNKLAQ